MLSHMQTMLTVFHSRGVELTCTMTDSGERPSSSPSLAVIVTGFKQQAQYDSSRTVFPAKGGIFESAIDSMAQPAQQWKRSSIHTSTWLG